MALIYGSPNRTTYGTNASDEIHINGKSVAYGRLGDDVIFGSASDNKIYGQDGNDLIYGDGGRDEAWGGRGDDTLIGGFLAAVYQPVKFYGEAGNDTLIGGVGTDFLDGGANDDWLWGSASDVLRGGAGADHIVYSSLTKGTDAVATESHGQVSGGAGQDVLEFQISTDENVGYIDIRMTGESMGTASIEGMPKLTFTGINEIIDNSFPFETNGALRYHGENADTDMIVTGGANDDVFFGGAGNETFNGGPGNDSFVFVFNETTMGHDRIGGFGQNQGPADPYEPGFDTIYFQGAEGTLTTTQVEHDNMTTFSSYYTDGRLAHVLDVDAVGLPPIGHFDNIIG